MTIRVIKFVLAVALCAVVHCAKSDVSLESEARFDVIEVADNRSFPFLEFFECNLTVMSAKSLQQLSLTQPTWIV